MYQVFYYADRAMTRQMPDYDTGISDSSLSTGRYKAPGGRREVAHAQHSGDVSLDRYGYAGRWHKIPPKAALAADPAPVWRW